MKKTLFALITIAVLAGIGFGIRKVATPRLTEEPRPSVTPPVVETVAYLSDLERRIAMFIVPVNYTTNGPWAGFELKASTNNFCHKAADGSPIEERVFMQYFMDSDVADTAPPHMDGACPRDKAKLYICNEVRNDQGLEHRSYTRIPNTASITRHIEEVVVLVDSHDLIRYPEDWKQPAQWLTWHNNNLMWIYGRKGGTWWEEAYGTKPMWRPIAPVRWFKEIPNWAQLADEEYYEHFSTNALPEVQP